MYGGQEELIVNGYTDAAFQTDIEDSRSQSRFVFCLNRGVVSWKSSKQDTVADSTIESEYIAASKAAKEAVWIRKFITGLGVVPSILDLIELFVTTTGPSHRLRSLGHIRNPNIYSGGIISSERSLTEGMSKFARSQVRVMLQIH